MKALLYADKLSVFSNENIQLKVIYDGNLRYYSRSVSLLLLSLLLYFSCCC